MYSTTMGHFEGTLENAIDIVEKHRYGVPIVKVFKNTKVL